MSNSPSVKFAIENNNLELTTPSVGVSCLLARTKKGPYNDPSKLITNLTQFHETFGEEIVPDGTPSNIEKALIGGSKLRIIRVPGKGYFKGVLLNKDNDPSEGAPEGAQEPQEILALSQGKKKVTIGFYTKVGAEPVDGAATFTVTFYKQANTIYYAITGTGKTTVLESNPVITFKDKDTVNRTSVDYIAFNNFLRNSAFLEPKVLSSNLEGGSTIEAIINWLSTEVDNSETALGFQITTQTLSTEAIKLISQVGSDGTDPTADEWIAAAQYIRDYNEPYQVACSHINEHLAENADVLKVHKAIKEMADELQEFVYYIEVPKYTTHYTEGDTVRDQKSIIEWIDTCIGTVGNSMYVAYFAGGIRMYNSLGNLVNASVLGSIMGLGDKAASTVGPWRSFAGVNRGVIYDGNGSVCPNYGSPSRYEELNELAHHYANMIVVRNTRNSGKRTMLWHCFTSQVKQDSFRFLAIVRLVLYLKKFLRPILESYIEEPNTWSTWKSIYLEVKPELDDLVEQNAMTEYQWMGDQDASSYKDLEVNNEQDVRNGRYKVILKFKEVVPLQEITMVLSIDKASNNVTTEIQTE